MTVNLEKLPTFAHKPRIFILTDVLNEPDDSQSLVRYLLYSNEFDTRGICATTSTWLRSSTHPEELRRIITAYGEVVNNLNKHVHPSSQYRSADSLLSLVTSGPRVYGKKALKEPHSEGAQRLLAALQESEEPLYIPVWGGVNTLAQALKHLAETSSPNLAARERAKLRVYSISDQDDTGAWIRAKYPDVFYIVSMHGWDQYSQGSWLGMNASAGEGVDHTKVLNPWLNEHIRVGKFGANAYPEVKFGMEGDTPSFLWLIQNGLGYRDFINWGGWGGRYIRPQSEADWEDGIDGNRFHNAQDFGVIGVDGKAYTDHKATIWRWGDAVQDDFAARMHWTLTDNFADAAHPPVVDVNGCTGTEPLVLEVKPGETHVLDASGTYSADNCTADDPLEYTWMLYGDVNGFHFFGMGPEVQIETLEGIPSDVKEGDIAGFAAYTRARKVKVTVPQIEKHPQTGLFTPDFHILLQVTNRAGPYPIRRYKRIIFSYIQEDKPVPHRKIPESANEAYRMYGNIDVTRPRVDYSQPLNYTPCNWWGWKVKK
ncbi:uncharacterized protein N7496_010239 [Penicillium cataractarum]|uniref:DUF1593-domain-containing protein n=1 Tax=Penicillium cataractarum TaxID=2100454 RepID=A0A9W9V366_9EURO|nr:uncharacterized protein N7496_010239 [Penicillium cataractarum]KAJ5364526.1 hypothetical protein N7496_010239 [Penicillium cataractarum]